MKSFRQRGGKEFWSSLYGNFRHWSRQRMSMNNGRQVKQNMFPHSDMSQVCKQTHHMFFRDIQLIERHYYFALLRFYLCMNKWFYLCMNKWNLRPKDLCIIYKFPHFYMVDKNWQEVTNNFNQRFWLKMLNFRILQYVTRTRGYFTCATRITGSAGTFCCSFCSRTFFWTDTIVATRIWGTRTS